MLTEFSQQWHSTYFKPTSLHDLGLRICPSHRREESCTTASPAADVVVLHTNGIHVVTVQFCKCWGLAHRSQLLRIAWWPATPFDPKTCATFELLRQFHLLNLQGKLPAYDFCRALELQTDNTGLQYVPVSCVLSFCTPHCADALPCRIGRSSLWSWCASGATSRLLSEPAARTIPPESRGQTSEDWR